MCECLTDSWKFNKDKVKNANSRGWRKRWVNTILYQNQRARGIRAWRSRLNPSPGSASWKSRERGCKRLLQLKGSSGRGKGCTGNLSDERKINFSPCPHPDAETHIRPRVQVRLPHFFYPEYLFSLLLVSLTSPVCCRDNRLHLQLLFQATCSTREHSLVQQE